MPLSSLKPFEAGGGGDCFFRSVAAADTKSRKVINQQHLKIRFDLCKYIDEKKMQAQTKQMWLYTNQEFYYWAESTEKLKKRGEWGDTILCSTIAQLYNRNVILLLSPSQLSINTPPVSLYPPTKTMSEGNFDSFEKPPIIIYSTPGHFQGMISTDESNPTDVILKEINQILKQRIINALDPPRVLTGPDTFSGQSVLTDATPLPAANIEIKPKKKSFIKILMSVISFIPALICKFFRNIFRTTQSPTYTMTNSMEHCDGYSLDFFQHKDIRIVCEHENIYIQSSTNTVSHDKYPPIYIPAFAEIDNKSNMGIKIMGYSHTLRKLRTLTRPRELAENEENDEVANSTQTSESQRLSVSY